MFLKKTTWCFKWHVLIIFTLRKINLKNNYTNMKNDKTNMETLYKGSTTNSHYIEQNKCGHTYIALWKRVFNKVRK